ncbi:hypothetical protein LTR16_004483, partial [Cryomyces antarcticus]
LPPLHDAQIRAQAQQQWHPQSRPLRRRSLEAKSQQQRLQDEHRPGPAHPEEPRRRASHRGQSRAKTIRRRAGSRARNRQPDGQDPREGETSHRGRVRRAHGRRGHQARARTSGGEAARRAAGRCDEDRLALLRRLHQQHALPDLVALDVQAAGDDARAARLHPHVPARVRHAAVRQAGRQAVQPAERQRADVGQDRPRHEGRQEQLQPAAAGRVERRAPRAQGAAPGHQLRGVGRPAADLLCAEEQDAARELLRHAQRHGDAGDELPHLLRAERRRARRRAARHGKRCHGRRSRSRRRCRRRRRCVGRHHGRRRRRRRRRLQRSADLLPRRSGAQGPPAPGQHGAQAQGQGGRAGARQSAARAGGRDGACGPARAPVRRGRFPEDAVRLQPGGHPLQL